MLIAGVQKLTTLDYPGHLATIVFTAGCNFRCGYCHNPHLVDPEQVKNSVKDFIPENVFFNFLKKRKGLTDGVCITGGEPTLQPDLIEFALKIKREGFLVKIDTNGADCKSLKNLLENKAVDYFAMDIKTSPLKYEDIISRPVSRAFLDEIRMSKDFIQNSGIPYEFRTTAVKEKHTPEIFDDIGRWLEGAENFYIQNFRNKTVLSENYKNYGGFSEKELVFFKSIMDKYVKNCGIRM